LKVLIVLALTKLRFGCDLAGATACRIREQERAEISQAAAMERCREVGGPTDSRNNGFK